MSKAKPTAGDVARWMRDTVISDETLEQAWAAPEIEERFGSEFTYENENGNPAIRRDVLAEFRRLTEGRVVWSRSERAWRKQKTPRGNRLAD